MRHFVARGAVAVLAPAAVHAASAMLVVYVCVVAPGVARAQGSRASVTGRVGLLAVESGATNRAAVPELGLGLRWLALPSEPMSVSGAGVSVGYRGALRRSGNARVGALYSVHRFQLGLFGELRTVRLRAGLELAGQAVVQMSRIHAMGVADRSRSRWSPGGAAEGWVAVALSDSADAAFVLGGYWRPRGVDLLASVGMAWRL